MEERSVVSLLWEGPLLFGRLQDASPSEAMPPDRSGIYLWTIPTEAGRVVSWVGEADNLRKKLLEHSYEILGGRHVLYDPEKLRSGAGLDILYEADLLAGNWEYVVRFAELSEVAVANLQSYEMLWSELDGGRAFRQCVVSALIGAARVDGAGSGRVLQRSVVPVGRFMMVPITVRSRFPPTLEVPAFEEPVQYGEPLAG